MYYLPEFMNGNSYVPVIADDYKYCDSCTYMYETTGPV